MTNQYAYTQTNQVTNIDNEVNVNQTIINKNKVTIIKKKKKKKGGGLSDKILIFILLLLLLYYLLKSYVI